MLRSIAIIAAIALPFTLPLSTTAHAQGKKDVSAIKACIDQKAPTGDIPEKGPERDKIMKEAEGGPQACVGIIVEGCLQGGGKEEACYSREAKAWLAAIVLDKKTAARVGKKNVDIYNAAAKNVEKSAAALCRAAVAVSAWGAEAIKKGEKMPFDASNPCVYEAIAQQSLTILVNQRGS